MKRKVHSTRDDLDWTVRLLWFPEQILPVGPRQVEYGTTRPGFISGLFVMPFSLLIFLLLALPTLLVLLPLRFARVASWRIRAVAYPWGRLKPAIVKTWRVKGGLEDVRRVVEEVAAALERGEQQPRVVGAETDNG